MSEQPTIAKIKIGDQTSNPSNKQSLPHNVAGKSFNDSLR